MGVWEAGKDLIEPSKPTVARVAGWELLTECVKHPDSTDLERKAYFQTLSQEGHADDFHLQLAALVDLTKGGRDLSGFDYDVIPLLTTWLKTVFNSVKVARKSAAKGSKNGKVPPVIGEDKNLGQLFSFIENVIKFSFNVANDAAVVGLVERVLEICETTSQMQDLSACIAVINSIVTFGAIPDEKLSRCVLVLSSIYCLVPGLEKVAWHTLSNLCRSHNGQATVRILLEVLQNPDPENSKNNKESRDIRGSLGVLQKLLSKSTEKGYPTIPFPLLIEGLDAVTKTSSSLSVRTAVLSLINSLLGNGMQPHQIILDEDWAELLTVATRCASGLDRTIDPNRFSPAVDFKIQDLMRQLHDELMHTISYLEKFLTQDSSDFTQRHNCITFLAAVHSHLPDSAARILLDYYKEFRYCMPSDSGWSANVDLVMRFFLKNRKYCTETRLRALEIIEEAYNMVEIVADQLDEGTPASFVKSLLVDIAGETDIKLLKEILDLVVIMAVSAPIGLFKYITTTLREIVSNDRLRSPIPPPASLTIGPFGTKEDTAEPVALSPSRVVTTACIQIFMKLIHTDGNKTVQIYNLLISIIKSKACEIDARLAAMKLFFRLRADWGNHVFLTPCTNAERIAKYLYRTEASLMRRQADEQSQRARPAARPARGVSFGTQGPAMERNPPSARALGGIRPIPSPYRQQWMLPDEEALPEPVSSKSSPLLVSHLDNSESAVAKKQTALNMASWLDVLLELLQGSDWEVYSFALVHLPSQLTNHALFRGAITQIQELRRIICEQIKMGTFSEPPEVTGLRRSDVALCLFQLLTTVISYHEHFQKLEEDEIVAAFLFGLNTWDRSFRCCIHALAVCCHELPMSTSKSLVPILTRMSQIISQPVVSIHILEFLACLSRMPSLYSHFGETEYRTVFAVCFRYLQYVRDKKQSQRFPASFSTPSAAAQQNGLDSSVPSCATEDLPQYVYALAYHVITFWFHSIRLPDRALYVQWISKQLFSDVDGTQTLEEQAETTMDFMQRVAYADNDESVDDPLFMEERFGPINTRSWIIGHSIVTIRQAASSGWSQVTKRQPTGTSSFTIRESLRPPPSHQVQSHAYAGRDARFATNIDILPNHLMVHLFSIAPQTENILRPIPLPNDEKISRSLKLFDMISTVDGHKVGVIYIGEGQTKESEILANVSGSREYVEFLDGLGTLTRLKGAKFNTQGLDREYDTDGKYTFCWRDKVTEIVFHVTTQMPTSLDHDPQCINKKRHIGNDFVNIIFNDSGLPFRFDTFPGDFNYVKIVITPESRASFTASREKSADCLKQSFFKVHVMSKSGFPEISPASETKMISLQALPEFVRLLALNASVFSHVWSNRDGGEHISPWRQRLREIKRLREKYGPKPSLNGMGGSNPVMPSPPSTSIGMTAEAVGLGVGVGSRSGAQSIRDSLGSFRRSSVATFFTNTSEQTSHRSSMLSMANTTDTELIPSSVAGGDSIAETLDFSRWA